MSRFAAETSVSSEASRAEIERTLARYGASSFMYGWEDTKAIVGFKMNGRMIRFELVMPARDERRFTHTEGRGIARTAPAATKEWEQACRQKWRALALVVKAKLEAVESGISEFEEEFLAHIVLPDGQTVGRWMQPQIAAAYGSGKMPPMLPTLGMKP